MANAANTKKIKMTTITKHPNEFRQPLNKNSKIYPKILINHPTIPRITKTIINNNIKKKISILIMHLFIYIFNIEIIIKNSNNIKI